MNHRGESHDKWICNSGPRLVYLNHCQETIYPARHLSNVHATIRQEEKGHGQVKKAGIISTKEGLKWIPFWKDLSCVNLQGRYAMPWRFDLYRLHGNQATRNGLHDRIRYGGHHGCGIYADSMNYAKRLKSIYDRFDWSEDIQEKNTKDSKYAIWKKSQDWERWIVNNKNVVSPIDQHPDRGLPMFLSVPCFICLSPKRYYSRLSFLVKIICYCINSLCRPRWRQVWTAYT